MTQMPLAQLLEPDLIDRMLKAMRVAGVDRAELADRMGINRNTVGNYLGGKTKPSRPALMAWAMCCGVPFEWLEHGTIPADGPDGGGEGWAPRGSNPEPAD